MSRFIKLPFEALTDDRLSDRERRVLMALWSFGSVAGDVVWPSRETLSKLSRCQANHVSVALTRLIALGWIERKRVGQASNQYTLLVPEVPVSGLPMLPNRDSEVTDSGTFADAGTDTDVPVSGLPMLPNRDSRGSQIGTNNRPRTDQEQTSVSNDDVRTHTRAEEDKRPVGTSTGGEGPHNGDSAQRKPRKRAQVRCSMPLDWEPDASFWPDMVRLGIDRGFVESLIPEFRRYWAEQGEQRPGWERSFLSHVQRNWMREQGRPGSGVATVSPLRHEASAGGHGRLTFDELKLARTREAMQAFLDEDLSEGQVYEAR